MEGIIIFFLLQQDAKMSKKEDLYTWAESTKYLDSRKVQAADHNPLN